MIRPVWTETDPNGRGLFMKTRREDAVASDPRNVRFIDYGVDQQVIAVTRLAMEHDCELRTLPLQKWFGWRNDIDAATLDYFEGHFLRIRRHRHLSRANRKGASN